MEYTEDKIDTEIDTENKIKSSKCINTCIISLEPPTKKIRYLKNFGLNPKWIKGIDIKNDPIEIKSYVSPFMQKFGPNGMIGSGMAHMKTWEYIISENLDYAIIFEDDVLLTRNFTDILKNVLVNVPKDFDILYLGGFGCKSDINIFTLFKSFIVGNRNLPKQKYINPYIIAPRFVAAIHGYIISLKGAKKLISNLKGTVSTYLDIEILKLYCDKKINLYLSRPRIVFQTSTCYKTMSLNCNNTFPCLLHKLGANIELDRMLNLNFALSIVFLKWWIFEINIKFILFFICGILLSIVKANHKLLIVSVFYILFTVPDLIQKKWKYFFTFYSLLVIPTMLTFKN